MADVAPDNHKGVMLSERPKYNVSPPRPRKKEFVVSELPFFPGGNTKVYEPWGANPIPQILQPSFPLKKTVFDMHKKLLRRWQTAAAAKRTARDEEIRRAFGTYATVREQAATIRHAILTGAPDLAETWAPAARAASIRRLQGATDRTQDVPPPPSIDRAAVDAEMAAFVDACAAGAPAAGAKPMEPPSAAATGASAAGDKGDKGESAATTGVNATAAAAAPAAPEAAPPASKKKAGAAKPAWALSETEAADAEAEEEAELLSFASGLDFDAYIDDIEDDDLQSALRAMIPGSRGATAPPTATLLADKSETWKAQFVSAVNHLASKGWLGPRSAGPGSVAGSAAGPGSVAGTADGEGPKGAEAVAREVLAENPGLSRVHSLKSLKAIVERAAPPAAIEE